MNATRTHHPAGARASRAALWFGLLGGGVAWLLHFLFAYVIAEFGVLSGWGRGQFIGISGLSWLLLAVSLVMVLTAAAATLVAYRTRRMLQQRQDEEAETAEPDNVDGYMARTGFVTSAVFLFIILVESLPIFFFLRP